MSATTPTPDVLFDGTLADLDRLLAHASVRFLANEPSFKTDHAKSAFLASGFRGIALDWLASKLATTPTLLDNFESFKAALKASFGLGDSQRQSLAQTRIANMKQKGDLLIFLHEFEAETELAGCRSDITRTVLLLPMLEPYYQNALRLSTDLQLTYAGVRRDLLNLYSLRAREAAPERQRQRSKCGRCGKKGHTSMQCKGGN